MKQPIIKTVLLILLFIIFVSWHLKIIFLYILFLIWRKFIPSYQENRKLINRVGFSVFVVTFIILFPNRMSSKSDYIQSVYFDKATGEEVGEPWIPYMTNIIGEGEIMSAVSLGSYLLPENFAKGGALGDVIRYNKSTYYFNNNFVTGYREIGPNLPTHDVPFQMMQDKGYYKDIMHYYLHIPDVENLEDCEVIVYCHGYTGNWILYSQLFAKHTNAIIIAAESPSFSGYFSKKVMEDILNKTIPNAFDRIGIAYKKPHLIGLSNGGSAINTSLAYYPSKFKTFTILSASLRTNPRANAKVHIIYGSNDRSGGVSSKIPKSKYTLHRIKGEDHSLIVARPELTFGLINKIIGQKK